MSSIFHNHRRGDDQDFLYTQSFDPFHSDLRTEDDFKHEIERTQNYLRSLVSTKNQLYSAISQLPEETMAKIFYFYEIELNSSTTLGWGMPALLRYAINPRLLLSVLLVCRRWHEIAMNHPSLWARIDSMPWVSSGARALLKRSKNSPLSLSMSEARIRDASHSAHRMTYRAPPIGSTMSPYLAQNLTWKSEDIKNILEQSHGRIEEMDIALQTSTFALFAHSPRWEWPMLRSASIADEGERYANSGISPVPTLPMIIADSLTSLSISGLRPGDKASHFRFPNLRSLTWRFAFSPTWSLSLEEVVQFLSSTPRLEDLECDSILPVCETVHNPSISPVVLPNLKLLHCKGGHRSCALHLPRYIAYPRQCHIHYYLAGNDPQSDSPFMPPQVVDRNLEAILSSFVPRSVRLLRPTRLSLLYCGANSFGWAADVTLHAQDMEGDDSSMALRFELQRVLAYSGYDTNSREIETRGFNRDIEAMLTHTCDLSSLNTLSCSLELQTSTWTAGFTACSNLTEISLTGLPVAVQFAEAFIANTTTALPFLPSLSLISIQRESPRLYLGMGLSNVSVATAVPQPYDITWSKVLSGFSEAFSRLLESTHKRFPRFVIVRDFCGCWVNEDLMDEVHAWSQLATLVGEIILRRLDDEGN